MSTIAFIGLGHMGTPMSANLAAAGHTVRGYDIDPVCAQAAARRGVTIASSIADALGGAQACLTSLPMSEHVRAVYDGPEGIWASADPDTLLMDASTVDVETSQWCHDQSESRGFAFVDTPVSGGTAGAEAHSLTFMLGGSESDRARAREVVQAMAGSVIDCGGPTAGIAAKLVNNLMLFVSMVGVAEASQLAEQLGLDHDVFWHVADVSSGQSWPQRLWYPVPGVVPTAAAGRNFEATFSVDLARKDCGLALEAGRTTGVKLPAAALVLDQLQQLADEGWGGKDCMLITKLASPDGTLRGWDPDA